MMSFYYRQVNLSVSSLLLINSLLVFILLLTLGIYTLEFSFIKEFTFTIDYITGFKQTYKLFFYPSTASPLPKLTFSPFFSILEYLELLKTFIHTKYHAAAAANFADMLWLMKALCEGAICIFNGSIIKLYKALITAK